MNKEILIAAGFTKEVELIESGCCPICEKKIDFNSFRDEESRTEFKISGFCQDCQDEVFK